MTDAAIDTRKIHDTLQDMVVESDTGARRPNGFPAKLMIATALAWSLFQLWIASPLPYILGNALGIPVLDGVKSSYIHLAFALFLGYLSYPATKRSPKKYIPVSDWIFALLSVVAALYLLVFSKELAFRVGIPNETDMTLALIGMALLIEATRRALGPPLMVIMIIFLGYAFLGAMDFIPDLIRHKGQSLNKISSHMWLTTEGVFGVALEVSTSFVFLFVLFGSLLDKAGAGNYFIKFAISLVGHMRGGPAKASVMASGLTGIISGSSIANVVTTGTFTIPLMRRVGFTREQAGAIEVAAGIDGQIMPPVMGAAAFLMVEYVGIPYTEIIKHAFLPAVLSYAALLYMVHLEAVKHNMKVLPKVRKRSFPAGVLVFGITVSSLIILSWLVYHTIGWFKVFFPESASYIIGGAALAIYISLLWFQAKVPDLTMDDPHQPIASLPETWATVRTGMHFLLPVIILVWCLMVERFSPGLAAFYASLLLIFILVTQHPLKAFFRKNGNIAESFKRGGYDLFDGLVTGARNMVGIGIATAGAGIIVGTVSLTGIGQVLTEVVEVLSGGSLILILIYTAAISLVLGMGLPTTANYIVVASLMAHVVQDLGAQNGLIVPAIAIHMFVFYYGIMADVTPPVGLASFAASAIAGGDPIRTGLQGTMYSLRTAILPFFFIFDPELLLIGVDSVWVGVFVALKAMVALMLFSAALQGYFIVRSKWYESVLLLMAMFIYFAPQLCMDMLVKPYGRGDLSQLDHVIMEQEPGKLIKLYVTSYDADGKSRLMKTLYIPAQEGKTSSQKLHKYGVILRKDGDRLLLDDVVFNSTAEKTMGLEEDFFDYEHVVTGMDVPQPQPSKRWMNIPATLLLGCVVILQLKRRKKSKLLTANA